MLSSIQVPSRTLERAAVVAEPRAPERWVALDLFRVTAVLLMIQGHTFTALLEPAAYDGAWVRWHALIHGLTAPMFLFGAGLAYGLVTFDPRASAADAVRTRWRICRRACLLIAVGTLLQWPRVPLHTLWSDRTLQSVVLAVGPLQLVGACLLLCEGLRRLLPSARALALALLSSGALVAVIAPWVWSARGSERHLLGGWLDGRSGSQFPFLPWAAFFLLAAAGSVWLARAPGRGEARRPWQHPRLAVRLALGGLALSALSYALYLGGVQLRAVYGPHDFWHSNPLFVAFRAGLVLLWLALLCSQEQRLRRWLRAAPVVSPLIGSLARQSLVAYVVHLLLIYGTPLTRGLARGAPRLPLFETTGAVVYVLTVTVALAMLWDRYTSSAKLQRQAA